MLLTIRQAADILNVHPNTVRMLIDRHKIEAVNIMEGVRDKRLIRIAASSLDDFINASTTQATTKAERKHNGNGFRLERRRD